MTRQKNFNTIQSMVEKEKIFSGLFVSKSGQINISAGCQDTLESEESFRILFAFAGHGLIVRNKKNIPIQQNDVYIQAPFSHDKIYTDANSHINFIYIELFGPACTALFDDFYLNKDSAVITGLPGLCLAQEMKTILLYSNQANSSDYLFLLGSLYKVLSYLYVASTASQWTKVLYSDSSILYTGKWVLWPSPFDENNNECYTSTPRSYAEYNFYGTGIKWYGTTNFDCGKADVIIDGIYQTSVDTYSPNRLSQQLLYINTHLSRGNHIIKIFCTGEKNERSSNCDIVVESFHFILSDPDYGESTPTQRHSHSKIIEDAIYYLKKNYQEEIAIQQVAKALKVSPSYLSNKFSSETGRTLVQYLTSLRLKQAKYLLEESNLSVSQIAQQVGYSDPFYFSKIFRKRENVSPTQYRLLHKG